MNAMDERVARLQAHGLIDLHFDLPMDLYEKRHERDVLAREFLPQFEAGNIAVLAAAVFIEDRYLPDQALPVALDQVACLKAEAERSGRVVICKSFPEIEAARAVDKVAMLISMEGVEPIGTELHLLHVFHDLGVRIIGLTHARPNAAASGGLFAPSGSSPEGLTSFGRELVAACEELGIIFDLAHINAAGFEDVLSLTKRPVIVSHTNARRYHDIERNISDAQVKMIGQRGGVVGVNSVLVSPDKEGATLDRYVDHIEHIAGLIGIDGVGLGFDFFEFIYRRRPEETNKMTRPHFIPDLSDHSHAPNLTRRLIERRFSDADIEKILFRNWERIFQEML
jgi:membrane dipeptidase